MLKVLVHLGLNLPDTMLTAWVRLEMTLPEIVLDFCRAGLMCLAGVVAFGVLFCQLLA